MHFRQINFHLPLHTGRSPLMASVQEQDLSERLRDTEAALSLLANLLRADPGLGLEMAQMPVPGGSATDLPSMLAAALNLLCGLATTPIHVIGAIPSAP